MINLIDPASAISYYVPYIEPEDVVPTRYPAAMRDYSMGPASIGNTAQGHQVQTWVFEVVGGNIVTGPASSAARTVIAPVSGTLASLSGDFDPDGRPNVAYSTSSGQAYVVYYYRPDPEVAGTYESRILVDAESPRVVMPDKRGIIAPETHVFYLKDGWLCGRDQADLYLAETVLREAPVNTARLGRVGMNGGWRLQIEFRIHL